jgi:hypothetical protein
MLIPIYASCTSKLLMKAFHAFDSFQFRCFLPGEKCAILAGKFPGKF